MSDLPPIQPMPPVPKHRPLVVWCSLFLLLVVMVLISVPNCIKSPYTAPRNACINNLRQIDAAKQQWGIDQNKQKSDTPAWDDVTPYLKSGIPVCPEGGTYMLNKLEERPTCSIPEHKLPEER